MVTKKLVNLRKACVKWFFGINTIFVAVVLTFTCHRETLSIKWPFTGTQNITYTDDGKVYIGNSLEIVIPIFITIIKNIIMF